MIDINREEIAITVEILVISQDIVKVRELWSKKDGLNTVTI